MPTFLYSIARQCARNRMRVLLGWALALTLTVGAAWVFAAPFNETISIPDSESASAQATLSNTFPEVADQTATVVIIAPTEQRLDSQSAKEAISAYLYTLSELPYIKGVIPPFTEPFSGMESKDATRALAYLRIDGPAAGFHSGDLADLTAQVKTLRYFLDGADVELGGDLYTVPNRSFSAVEASCIFLVAIILVIVLKSLMASAIVLTACLIGTVSTISIGLLARNFGAINFLSLTISIMIGSVLGILFALPIVARHRSQITSGMEITESIALAVGRSGNTIISQSLAVAVTAGMMLCVGIPPFTATGVLVLLTTAINVFSSCTALPALLGLANEWLAAESSPATVPVRSKLPGGARFALKHPIPAIALTALILIGTATQASGSDFGFPDGELAPSESGQHLAFIEVSHSFGPGYNSPILVSANLLQSDSPTAVMEDLQSQLTTLPGVSRTLFASPNANVDTGAVWLIPETGQNDPATWELVRQIRAHAQQWQQLWGISIQVSGPAANYVDVAERIAAATWPIAVTLTITLLVLLLVTAGAFWPALASLAGCVLSIAAALGSAKLFFNDGLLASGVNTPGPIDVCLPLLGGGLFAGLGTAVAIAANAWFIEIHSAKPAPMALSPQVHLKQPIAMPDSAVKRSVLPGAYLRTIVIAAIAIFICFIPTGNATVRQFAFFWAAGTVFGFFWIKFAMAPIAERLFSSKRLRWLPAWLRARVFKLDMTGEKLANLESALIEYSNNEYLEALPNSEGSGGICATDLTVQIEGNLLFPPTSLDIPAGEVVAIIGNAFWAKVLLYGLAGRVQLTGTGSVNGYRLGDESWSIRKTSKIIDVETPISEYCKWPQLVIVEGIDIFPQDKLAAIETAIASTLPAIADTSGSQAHAESIGSVDVSFPSTTHQSAGENSGTVTWLLSSVQPPPLFFSYCIDLDAENVSVDATGSANRQEL